MLNTTIKNHQNLLSTMTDKVSKIIDDSQEIRENSLGYMAEENEESIRKECFNKVKIMLMKMQKQVT